MEEVLGLETRIDKQGLCPYRSSTVRLFQGAVTPIVLYGSGCWTMTKESERRLRACQRRMLRLIIGVKRRVNAPQGGNNDNDVDSNATEINFQCEQDEDDDCLEPWVDFIKRTTHDAEERLRRLNIEDWITAQRRRKWNFARRVASQNGSRWSNRVAKWNPELTSARTSRQQGRPKKRWQDDIENVLRTGLHNDSINWMEVATNDTLWRSLESLYVNGPNAEN